MKFKILTLSAILLLLFGFEKGQSHPVSKTANTAPQAKTANPETADEAYARCSRLTQSNLISKKHSIKRITVKNDNTPFLWKQIEGKTLWRIEFDECTLTLKSLYLAKIIQKIKSFPPPVLSDHYPLKRTFVVLMGGNKRTGIILKVTCRFSGNRKNIGPESSAQSTEKQMSETGYQIYTGFPKTDPKVTFLEAVSASAGNPCYTKEFDGYYVMYSEMHHPSEPIWMIASQGTPRNSYPTPPGKFYGYGSKSIWRDCRVRSVIDAKTGKLISFGN